jgi:O-antigen/teichoic acid export membrane protein
MTLMRVWALAMNKYLRAISTNFIFFAISAVFFVLVTPLAIHTMGEEFYGLWVILSAIMLFANIGNLGIDAIVMKFSAEAHGLDEIQVQSNRVITAGYLISFIMAMITGTLIFLTRNIIVNNININTELKGQFLQAILWIAAGMLPQFLARVPYGHLLSQLHNREARQIELFFSLSIWTGAVVVALIDKNLITIAMWCFFTNWLVFGLYFQASRRLMPFRVRVDLLTISKLIKFSKYLFIENLAISLFQHFDKIIVGFTLGPALAGVYSIGTSLALRISMVTGQATEVMIPYASLKASLDDRNKLYATYRRLSYYVSLLLAGISSFLIIWMNDLLSLWISADYATRYSNVFRVLFIAYSLLSLSRPAHQTLTGLGKVKFTAVVYLSSTILMLSTLFFLSLQYSLLGAATANLVMILLLIYNLFLYFTFEKPFPWKRMFVDLQWGLLLPALMYGVSQFFTPLNLLYKLLETGILGILFIWLMASDTSGIVKVGLLQLKQVILNAKN